MRIVSLLSSATEIVHELGLEDQLVGISHECDHPPEALRLPRVSRPRFDPEGLSSGEIDEAVRRSMQQFGSVYEVDHERLGELQPDLVLTQAVCEVCAVPTGSVRDAVAALDAPPQIASLDSHTLAQIFDTVEQVAEAAGRPERGREAVERLRARRDAVAEAVRGRPRPRVLMLEWLDPLFAPGHWVPEMVEIAGGDNLRGEAGAASRQLAWEEAQGLDPDVLLIAPCGYDLEQARADAERERARLERLAPRALAEGQAWLLHSSFFSRSGPRVVDGIETLGRILHPDACAGAPLEGRAERW